jgi:hypothetical protein
MDAIHRMLIVADRSSDPGGLMEVLRTQAQSQRISATVVVPASLNGLEWLGDPYARVPDAERQAALLQAALLNIGVVRCEAQVGDPDMHAAIDDALAAERFDEVLINVRSPRIASALHVGVADRVSRETDAEVTYLRARRAA